MATYDDQHVSAMNALRSAQYQGRNDAGHNLFLGKIVRKDGMYSHAFGVMALRLTHVSTSAGSYKLVGSPLYSATCSTAEYVRMLTFSGKLHVLSNVRGQYSTRCMSQDSLPILVGRNMGVTWPLGSVTRGGGKSAGLHFSLGHSNEELVLGVRSGIMMRCKSLDQGANALVALIKWIMDRLTVMDDGEDVCVGRVQKFLSTTTPV